MPDMASAMAKSQMPSMVGALSAPSMAAIFQKSLTPQEMNLYRHHLANLYGGQAVMNTETGPLGPEAAGSTSTVLQRVVSGPGGRFYSIPSVWDGKILSENQARERAAKKGWDYWPSYATPEEADRRYMEDMHPAMELDMNAAPPAPVLPTFAKAGVER